MISGERTELIMYALIPLTALIIFLLLIRKIKNEKIEKPPVLSLFILILHYSILLLVTATAISRNWHDFTTVGSFYLMSVSLIAVGIVTYRSIGRWRENKYRLLVLRLGILYFVIFCSILFLNTKLEHPF